MKVHTNILFELFLSYISTSHMISVADETEKINPNVEGPSDAGETKEDEELQKKKESNF